MHDDSYTFAVIQFNPADDGVASNVIDDKKGNQLRKIPLTLGNKVNSVEVSFHSLAANQFTHSLYFNRELLDSREMVFLN